MWHVKIKLQDLLNERGLSYEEFAKLSRLPASILYDVALGFKKPNLGQIAMMMKALDIDKMSDLVQIYKGKEDKED